MEKLELFSVEPELSKCFHIQRDLVTQVSGIDCSEVVENFLAKYKGSALLLLSQNYEKGEMFEMHNSNNDMFRFNYHYAFISEDGVIYDAFLGIISKNLYEYLNTTQPHPITLNSLIVKEIKDSKTLESFI